MKKIQTILKKSLLTLLLAVALVLTAPSTAHMQAVYDCGTYSSDAYSENCPEEGPGGGGTTDGQDGGGSTDTGNLSETGENSGYYGIIGVICIAVSVGLFLASRKKQKNPRE